jgi:hypothetical protein
LRAGRRRDTRRDTGSNASTTPTARRTDRIGGPHRGVARSHGRIGIAWATVVGPAVVVRAALIVAPALDIDRRRLDDHRRWIGVVRLRVAASVVRFGGNTHTAGEERDAAHCEAGTKNTNFLHEGLLVGLLFSFNVRL